MRWLRVRRVLLVSIPALVVSAAFLAVLVETWVRLSWDPKRGTPGFFVSDPVRGQRLSANYDGWFAGVPVRTNALGFRDTRDYDLPKRANTFRILVLGDSVTFGHGAVHDYPSLLAQRLKEWRPDTDWQVWNLAVPGYNTSQELAHLLEVGPTYQPNLVIVGFFINDIIGNQAVETPGPARRVASRMLATVQRRWYSFEFYKRVALTVAWRLSASGAARQRFENLESEERMAARMDTLAESDRQRLTPFARLTDDELNQTSCADGMRPNPDDLAEMQARPDWPAFVDAVHGFQKLHREGTYQIVFFLNSVPPICPDGDWFYDGKSLENDFLLGLFARGAPTVSTYEAFLRVRPSEMPLAEAHAIGNANQLKAETLFEFLQKAGLTAPASTGTPAR